MSSMILISFLLASMAQNVFAISLSSTLCRTFDIRSLQGETCISIPTNWDRKNIVYFLHGSGGSAKYWDQNQTFQKAMRMMENQNLKRPLVVSISFGQWWLLKDFGRENQGALLDIYLQIQKETELEIFKDKVPSKRYLMGLSMGGYNSLLLLAKKSLEFDRVALICPGVAIIGPYSSVADISAYLKRNQPFINDQLIFGLLDLLGLDFPTYDVWATHSPFGLLESLKSRRQTAFYISGNTLDEYGFGEGAELLAQKMKKLDLTVDYEVVPGRHCVMNPSSIVNFLK